MPDKRWSEHIDRQRRSDDEQGDAPDGSDRARRRHRRRRPHPGTTHDLGGLHRSAVPRPGVAVPDRRAGSRGAGDRRAALDDEPPWVPGDARRDGRARPAGDPEGPRPHLRGRGPVRQHGSERAARVARRRGPRRGDPVHDGRPAVGGRAEGSRAVPGVHQGLQPLDLRVLLRLAAPGADRPPVAVRSDRRGPGVGAGGG